MLFIRKCYCCFSLTYLFCVSQGFTSWSLILRLIVGTSCIFHLIWFDSEKVSVARGYYVSSCYYSWYPLHRSLPTPICPSFKQLNHSLFFFTFRLEHGGMLVWISASSKSCRCPFCRWCISCLPYLLWSSLLVSLNSKFFEVLNYTL